MFVGNKNYRLLLSASAISNLGDGISVLAYPWLATMISRDPMDIAFVAFASRLPWFVFTLPAGVITDRFEHRKLMVAADLFRFILTIAIVAAIFFTPDFSDKGIYIPLLSLAAFMFGLAEVLRDNTAQTMLPTIVEGKDLPEANGQLWSMEKVMGQFVGPPLAGFLIAVALPLPFLVDAVTFAIAAALVSGVSVTRVIVSGHHQPAFAAMKEGFTWLVRHPVLFHMAVMTGLLNLGGTISLTVMVLFAQDVLNLGATGYGLLLSCGAVGGVIGGLVAPRIVQRIGKVWGLRIAVTTVILESGMIAFAAHPAMVGVALFAGVFGGMMWNVIAVPFRQRLVPPELLGRVNSVYRFFAWGMMPIGALLGGVLVSQVDDIASREIALRAPYFAVAVGSILMTIMAFRQFTAKTIGGAEPKKDPLR